MRSRGQGYAGIEKFTSLVNIDEYDETDDTK